MLGIAHPGDLGDVCSQVAHPGEVGAHPGQGDQRAQLAGDRLLGGQQRETAGVQIVIHLVEHLVARDDGLRRVQVGLEKRPVGAFHRGADEVHHRQHIGHKALHLVPVAVSHRSSAVIGSKGVSTSSRATPLRVTASGRPRPRLTRCRGVEPPLHHPSARLRRGHPPQPADRSPARARRRAVPDHGRGCRPR